MWEVGGPAVRKAQRLLLPGPGLLQASALSHLCARSAPCRLLTDSLVDLLGSCLVEELGQPSELRQALQQGRQQHLQQLVSQIQNQDPAAVTIAPPGSLPALAGSGSGSRPPSRGALTPHQIRTSSSNLKLATTLRIASSTSNLPAHSAHAALTVDGRPSTAPSACHSPEPAFAQRGSVTFPPLGTSFTPPGAAVKEDERASAGTAPAGGPAAGSSAARTSAGQQLLQGVTAIAMDKGKWGAVRISYSQFVEVVGTCLVLHSMSLHRQEGGTQPQSLKISDNVLEHFGVGGGFD
jgi:hypothetical protein